MRKTVGPNRGAVVSRLGVGTLAASTLAFAAAGLIASRVVASGYGAGIELQAPDVPEAQAFLREASAVVLPEPARAAATQPAAPVVVWQEAATRSDAERTVQAVADRITDRFALLQAPLPVAPPPVIRSEPKLAALSPAPSVPAATSPVLSELQRSATAARQELDATTRALAEFEGAQGSEEVTDDRLEAATGGVNTAGDEIASLRRGRERLLQPNPAPEAIAALPRIAGRDEFAATLTERNATADQIRDLSRTLLDGHPRMAAARARLRDLDAQVAALRASTVRALDARIDTAERQLAGAKKQLASVRDDESRRQALLMRGSELVRARDLAREVSFRLDDAVRRAESSEPSTPPVIEPAPAAAPDPVPVPEAVVTPPAAEPLWQLSRTVLPTQARHADPIPVAAFSALFGFALAGLGLAARRRGVRLPEPVASQAWDTGEDTEPHLAPPTSDDPEVTPIDDVIDGAISSGITRIMLCGAGAAAGGRPLAVSIARRLSLRGRAVALVDLSPRQSAARIMGVGATAPTLSDLIEGHSSFAAIAARDFATQAEIVPGGTPLASSRLDTPNERRNVLDFVEKSYEVIVVDCSDVEPERVATLMEADAALLLGTDGLSGDEIRRQSEALRRAGLLDMLLVREGLSAR